MSGLYEAVRTRYGKTDVKATMKDVSQMLRCASKRPHLVQQSGIWLEANISSGVLLFLTDNHFRLT